MTDLSLLQDFVTETVEHLEEMESNLLQLESDPGNRETLNDIFRSVHTIKGAAEYLGMERIAELSHKLENLLDLLRHNERSATREIIDLLIAARDRLGILIADLHQTQSEQTGIEDLLDRIHSVGSGKTEDTSEDPTLAANTRPPATDANAAAAPAGESYEEEHDEELFGIFLEQLQEGLDALQSWTHALSGSDSTDRIEILGRCLEQMDPLRSSANYMGYGKLTVLYDQWRLAIEKARDRLADGDDAFLAAFVATDMQANIDEIGTTFPRLRLSDPASQGPENPDARNSADDIETPPEEETATTPLPEARTSLTDDGGHDSVTAPVQNTTSADLNPFAEEESHGENLRLRPEKEGTLDLALLQDFITETVEHLGEMEARLLQLEGDPDNREILNDIFRAMHTIKGAAEYMGMTRIADLSHRLETLLDLMRHGKCTTDRGVIDLLMAARDRIGILTADLHQTQSEQAEIDDLLARIQAQISKSSAPPETTPVRSHPMPPSEAGHTPQDDQEREIYDEEYDGELFAIFLEQLHESLDHLESLTHDLPDEDRRGRIDILEDCLTRIDPLRSSANYMGYRKLTAVYDQWSEAIRTALDRLENDEDKFMPAFIAGCMQATVDDIRRCFPNLSPPSENGSVRSEMDMPGVGEADDVPETAGMATDLLDVYAEAPEAPAGMGAAPTSPDGVNDADSLFDRLSQSFDHRMSENQICGSHTAPSGMDWELFSEEEADALASSETALTEEHLPDAEDPLKAYLDLPETVAATIPSDGKRDASAETEGTEPVAPPLDPREETAEESENLFQERPVDFASPQVASQAPPEVETRTPSEDPVDDIPAAETATPVATPMELREASPDRGPSSEEKSSVDLDRAPGDRRDPSQRGRRKSDRIGEQLLRQSIRVDAGKIDALMNQVGELVVSRAWFSQLFHEMRDLQQNLQHHASLEAREMKQVKGLTFRLSEATVALGRVANELQEGVMKVRMLPIAQLFNRYPRLVFDLVRNGNKKVRLDIKGEETELDKMVIEAISDPLIHIIRNAVDHGIESAEERLRLGKPESGTIHLEAYHEGNHVVIEITDDGRGLDLERIKAKAVSGGFASREEIERMPSKELTGLIMQPGFSTAAAITHTSGRGVGMDVVKQNIEKLNGTIEIDSMPGVETRFRIKIPLTLAIIPALLVQVRGELFTIPLSTVEETIRIAPRDLSTIEGVEVMQLRDSTLPLVRLADLFNMPAETAGDGRSFVVVVSTGMKRVGLVVDVLLGQEEVVIKPLEDYLQEKSGFSGATILGDGRISLILDIYELVNLSIDRQSRRKQVAVPV
jgi:two-component system chemotaxis sensor kinase CheA